MLRLPERWRNPAHARNAVARQLRERHFLRMHALALFAWTVAIAYLTSKLTFANGMQSLPARYFITGISAYLGFLIGVKLWLWYVDATEDKNRDEPDAGDMLDLVEAQFDIADFASSSSGDVLGGVGDGIGAAAGEGCVPVLIIALLAIVAALLFALVGPELLIEIAFEAVLAGSLVSTMRLGREPDWLWAAFRKTIGTFLIIMLLMMGFGKYAQKHYPEAKTTKQVIQQILPPKDLKKQR
ncbi:MAG: hypothetical protein V4447_03255 [Pseudomonadota bacterium]